MAASMKKFLTRVIPQTNQSPVGSVLFLHGSGDSGAGLQDWVTAALGHKLSFPHLRILYPTAPARPYTPNNGLWSNVWYDRRQISPTSPDDESVDKMASELTHLLENEMKLGIPLESIIIGGFSMGGGMALQMGYKHHRNVAGVFALSSFLSTQSNVYQSLKDTPTPVPPLFQSHGDRDEVVPYPWGVDTYDTLKSLGVDGLFHSIPGQYHSLDRNNLRQLRDWINTVIPPPDS